EAEQLVVAICGPIEESAALSASKRVEDAPAIATLVEIEQEEKARFRNTYVNVVRPFLANPDAPGAELAESRRAAEIFESLRHLLPASIHPAVADLESICEEERQLNRQIRIYDW